MHRIIEAMSYVALLLITPYVPSLAGAQTADPLEITLGCPTANQDQGDESNETSLAYIIKNHSESMIITVPLCGEGTTYTPMPYTFKSSLSIPERVTLKIVNGARLRTEGSSILDIRGPIDAGNYQIVDHARDPETQELQISRISLRMREGTLRDMPAPFEWWGAQCVRRNNQGLVIGEAVNSSPFIEAAANASRIIRGGNGAEYLAKDPILLPSDVVIEGNRSSINGPENPEDNPIDYIFKVEGDATSVKTGVKIRDLLSSLKKAKGFIYVRNSSDVELHALSINGPTAKDMESLLIERAPDTIEFSGIDIHNSQNCRLSRLEVTGGGIKGDSTIVNPNSVGVHIRSDGALSGTGSNATAITIMDSIFLRSHTNVLVDLDYPSGPLRFENVSLKGIKDSAGEYGSIYGIRSIGSSRTDVSMENIHMEALNKCISFEPSPSSDGGEQGAYAVSIKGARFSLISGVLYLGGKPSDTVSLEMVDFYPHGDPYWDLCGFFCLVDATVTVKGEMSVALGQKKNGTGSVIYPNRPFKVEVCQHDSETGNPTVKEIYLASNMEEVRDFWAALNAANPDPGWWLYVVEYNADRGWISGTALTKDRQGIEETDCPLTSDNKAACACEPSGG